MWRTCAPPFAVVHGYHAAVLNADERAAIRHAYRRRLTAVAKRSLADRITIEVKYFLRLSLHR